MNNLGIFRLIAVLRNFYVYMPIQTFFLLSYGIPLSAVIFSQTFYVLSVFISEVPTGILADQYGQRVSLVLGYALEALGLLLVYLFPSVLGLYIGASLQGVAGAFLSGSEEALLYESVVHERRTDYQKVYGQFLSDGQASFMIATAASGLIYATYGAISFSPLMLATVLTTFGASICAFFLTNHTVKLTENIGNTGSGIFHTAQQGFRLIWSNETIFTLTIATLLTLAGEYFMLGIYQPYFESHGVQPFWIGATLSLGAFLSILTTRSVHLLEKRFTLPTILLILNGLLGLLYLGLALIVHPLFLVTAYIGMNGLFNLQNPVISDYINTRTSSHIRTTVLSGISFTKRFFQIGVTALLGYLVGAWGIESGLLFMAIYLILGAAISYYLLVRCGCAHKIFETSMEPIVIES